MVQATNVSEYLTFTLRAYCGQCLDKEKAALELQLAPARSRSSRPSIRAAVTLADVVLPAFTSFASA